MQSERLCCVVVLLSSLAFAQDPLYTRLGSTHISGFGSQLAATGDVNKDGVPDFVVGAYLAPHPSTGQNHGMATVLSGKDGKSIFTFYGDSEHDQFGWWVAGAGDTNKDGYADVLVGAPSDDNNSTQSGSARLFSGKDGKILYTWNGDAQNVQFGNRVAGVGDVNGDGHDDVAVASVRSRFFANSQSGYVRVISGKDGTTLHTLYGSITTDRFGSSLCGVGDIDKDNYDDIVIGVPYAKRAGKVYGAIQIFSGRKGTIIRTVYSSRAASRFGEAVTCPGDTNRDGYPDILVSESGSGTAKVISGKSGTLLLSLFGPRGGSRRAMSGADIDGDGYADIMIGVDSNLSFVRIYSGKDGSTLHTLYRPSSSGFGQFVAAVGDIDGDKRSEIVVGAPDHTVNGIRLGAVHTFSTKNAFASYSTFGAGCGSTAATLHVSKPPRIGEEFILQISNLKQASVAVIMIGGSGNSWNGNTLPMDLTKIGMPSCKLYVNWLTQAFVLTGNGTAFWTTQVPQNVSLITLEFTNQCWVLDNRANALGVGMSNAGRGRIGS